MSYLLTRPQSGCCCCLASYRVLVVGRLELFRLMSPIPSSLSIEQRHLVGSQRRRTSESRSDRRSARPRSDLDGADPDSRRQVFAWSTFFLPGDFFASPVT